MARRLRRHFERSIRDSRHDPLKLLRVWETPLETWDWILRTNLLSVVHGIRAFVPRMLDQEDEGHIINTASLAAITTEPLLGPYATSKHAVMALSECLRHDLEQMGSCIGVTVLCPSYVRSSIFFQSEWDPRGRLADRGRAADRLRHFLRRRRRQYLSRD